MIVYRIFRLPITVMQEVYTNVRPLYWSRGSGACMCQESNWRCDRMHTISKLLIYIALLGVKNTAYYKSNVNYVAPR